MQPLVLLQEVLGGEAFLADVALPLLVRVSPTTLRGGRLGRIQLLRLGRRRGRTVAGGGQILWRGRNTTWWSRVDDGAFDNLLVLLLLQLLLLICYVDELGQLSRVYDLDDLRLTHRAGRDGDGLGWWLVVDLLRKLLYCL